MIKAIVVDDEKLVRRGFISLFDWASFGIAVVGEAADGKAALELLGQLDVDLLFTDITMPGLSGFDLIKQVQQQFPRIRSVVLTCHHEFDYVQEALRLGAIDYIVKTLLELENADETMERIARRLHLEDSGRMAGSKGQARQAINASMAYAFCPSVSDADGSELYRLPIVRRNPLAECDRIWLLPLVHAPSEEACRREIAACLGNRWQTALVTGLLEQPLNEVQRLLSERLRLQLFYRVTGDEPVTFAYSELSQGTAGGEENAETWLQAANDLRWSLYASEWDKLLQHADQYRPSVEAWAAFGEKLCCDWEALLGRPGEHTLRHDLASNRTWADWKRWLRGFASGLQERMVELSLTKEVMICLIRAMVYMRVHAGEKINQTDVAAHINMSRSYFSQCFARFAGEAFGVVLRRMRIDLAKSLLRTTSEAIYEVAARAGFEDDKYFSKLFREQVGQLPSEYRTMNGETV